MVLLQGGSNLRSFRQDFAWRKKSATFFVPRVGTKSPDKMSPQVKLKVYKAARGVGSAGDKLGVRVKLLSVTLHLG